MTGPGGDEVARVSVKVVPNTDDFQRDLKRQLQTLRDEELRIPLRFDLDTDDLDRQLRELRLEEIRIPVGFDVENVRDDVQRATERLEADPVDLLVQLDQAGLEAEIQEIMARLHDLDNEEATPEVILEATEARARLRELKAELAALSAEEIDIRVDDSGLTEVLGDVGKVRIDLEALARDPIRFELLLEEGRLREDLAAVLAELEALDGLTATPEVDANVADALARLTQVRAALEALDGRRAQLGIDVDANTVDAAAEIDAFIARQRLRNKITLDVDIDQSRLAVATMGVRGIFSTLAAPLRASLDAAGSAATGLFGRLAQSEGMLRGMNDDAAALVGRFGTIAAVAGRVVVPLVQMSALGTGLVLIGAAITAAWGAISAAISTIPGAIALVAAPIGVVALGLDGIKKAASSIKPEFDALRASVSATFEKGLTPAFQQLKTLIPQVQDEINLVAKAVSTAGVNFAVLLTSAQGVAALEGIFTKVSQAILGMQTGLQDITLTFLELANQKSVFDLLTTAVNDFGAAFKAAVTDSLVSGDFQAAMAGLSGTLRELSQGFTDLVNNGLTVFANAAPGVNRFLDSLTGFFNRFDWASLGRSVGAVFDGLGAALDRIPQGTIDAIARGFEDIGRTFQSAGFQQAIVDVINLLPQFLGFIQGGIEGLARFGQAFAGAFNMIRGFVANFGVVWDLLEGEITWDEAERRIMDGQRIFEQGFGQILDSLRPWGPQIGSAINTSMSSVPGAIQGSFAPITAAIEAEFVRAGVTAETSLRNMDLAIERGSANWEATARTGAAAVPPAVGAELGQVPPAAETALAPLQQLEALRGMRDQFTLAAADSMHAMSVGVQSGMAEVQQQFTAGMDTVSTNSNSAFQRIGQGFTIGMAGLATTVSQGMPAIQAAFNFENVGTQIGMAFLGMVGTFQLGMASLAATVTAGMPVIQAAFNFSTLQPQIGAVFLGLVGTFQLGMASLTATVTTGMLGVQAAFNFSTLQPQIGNVFLTLVGTFNLGMQSLANAVTLGMVGVQAAFNFTALQVQIGTVFLGLVGTFQLGMASLAATVAAGMPLIAQAFNMTALQAQIGAAFLSLVGTFTLGMASISAVVVSGMARATASMSSGMAGMAAAAAAGMSGVTAAINAGMAMAVAAVTAAGAQIAAAGTASMAAFGAAIASGMAQATAAVAAATAQMISQFTLLGQQIVTTATASMAAFGNAVRAGMAQAQAAVSAGVAAMVGALRAGAGQFRSVGVQMMQGLRAGILSQAGSIAAAAAQVVRQAVAAARAAAAVGSPSRLFLEIGAFMGEGLALGMERSVPRVEDAADRMAQVAVGAADKIGSAFTAGEVSSKISSRVEHSFGELSGSSSQALLGQQRIANGELSQSTVLLAAIVTELRALRAQAGKGGSVVGVAAGSRQTAELGAF